MKTALLLALLSLPLTAAADPTTCPPGLVLMTSRDADGVERQLCGIRVQGERQRPYPFSVSARGPLGWSPAEVTRSFVPEVLSPTRRTPF
ncbi:MAG: hypothetical protein U0325_04615 [Polyangiales bacterium]